MKKLNKFTAVSLCLVLLLVISFSTPVSADTVTQITTDIEPIATPVDDGIELTSAVDPIGSLDVVNEYQIGGWAYQSDIPNTPLNVHLYVRSHTTGEADIFSTTANGYRADLYNAGYGNGYHAFQYLMDWFDYPAGVYSIEAYAIGTHGNNPPLNYSPQNFTVESMTGNVEYVNSNGIGGWAWKSAAPDSEIRVHIYIQNSAEETLAIYNTTANQARSDLLEAGYGNGAHGFSCPIDWSTLPEEWLRVTAYAVDGTGTHPAFYDGWYDNRMPIYLIGMVDRKGTDFSTWATQEVINYVYNIGTPDVVVCNEATKQGLLNYIQKSSFCVVNTHGSATSLSYCIYPNTVYEERGSLLWRDFLTIDSDYFANTRCLFLNACSVGNEQENLEGNNMVKVFQSKGVETVVGFVDEVTYWQNNGVVNNDKGSERWAKKFVQQLGNGATVFNAVNFAISDAISYFEDEDEPDANKRYADAYEIAKGYGLVDVAIEGNPNQVVKH